MATKLNSRSLLTILLLAGLLAHQVSLGSEPFPASQWHAYGNDSGGRRHSQATQITRDNIHKLKPAWTYRTGEDYTGKKQAGRATFQATPLLIDGVLYLSTPSNRVIALNARTGEELWSFNPDIDTESGLYVEFTSRGVSYWRNPVSGEQRLFMGTIDGRLFALDVSTGKRVRSFGNDGEINLTDGVGTVDPGMYSVTSPPAVVNDTIIIGSAIGDNRRVRSEYGIVRAFDARSGVLRWSWDPIPRSETRANWPEWDPVQAQITGAANAWAPLSADPERGLVFIPTGSPSPDYYGGERIGSNLYANSVVALSVETGDVVWHFQTVHHDLWDYDVSAQPVLVEVTRNNEKIPAVAQATKMGHLFFLHRDTGEPIFPVEERPVPQSDVPGEHSWPTQPFPVITPPLVPQGLSPDDAWGLTPIDRFFAAGRIAQYRSEGIFTPPSLRGSIQYPGIAGGTNWGSLSFDSARELVILNTSRAPFVVTLLPREQYNREQAPGGYVERSPQLGTPYGLHREPLFSGLGVPLVKPPWGTLVAVSTRNGLIVWESTLGTIRDLTPLAWGKKWGTPSMGGPLTTASGVTFIAAAMDNYLRAFDTDTGEELWQARLPAGGQATPMTYQLSIDGAQYVVICAGGHGKLGTKLGDYVIAYALP